MNSLDRSLYFVLLLCALVVGCLLTFSVDAAAVDRPTEPGPYSAGYFDVKLSVENYDSIYPLECRYYYPATSDGEGAAPDPTGAPYPPIIYHIFMYGIKNEEIYNRTNDRDRIEFVVSHGFVVLTFTPFRSDAVAGSSFYNDLVYYTDSYDANVSSPLFGMIKKAAYGALGGAYGGSLSWINGAETERITAVHSLGPFFGLNYSDEIHGPVTRKWNDRNGAWMVQKGYASTAVDNLMAQFEHVEPDKIMVTIPKGIAGDPYRYDLVVAFFHYYLGGQEEYGTYLHGEEARNDTLTGQSWFRYQKKGEEEWVFQPHFTIDIPSRVWMDDAVSLNVNCDTPVLWAHPTLVHEWYLDIDEEPIVTSTSSCNVTFHFTDPGTFDYIQYVYKIGNVSLLSNTGSMWVRNVWPVADAGENATIYQDEHFELDGSTSTDTASDVDTLEYNWSVLGVFSGWRTDPTFEIDTSQIITFTANLMVRDRHGRVSSGSDSVTIEIQNRFPEATILDADTTSEEDEVVELTGRGNDSISDDPFLEFMWVFGDGTTSQWSSSNRANHTYSNKGTYTVTLQVRDPKGAPGSATLTITVENVAPEAGIDLPADGAEADMETKVTFAGWGRDTPSDNGSLWYFWDFGDGGTADGAEASHTYKEAGTYTVTLTVEDNDGATAVVIRSIEVKEAHGLEGTMVVSAAVGVLAILGVAFVASTEPGKYWLGLVGAPLFVRTKDVLDNKTRHALLGIIVANPGIHYNAVKEEFGLANGAAAYHLDVLERESFIRSARDGKLKRFYSIHSKVPEDVGMSPEETREAIVRLVRRSPGINQMGVMEELGLGRDAASYYLRELVKDGQLKAGKEGRFMVYRVR